MPNRHKQYVDSSAFKEYAYRKLRNITPEQKKSLLPDELVHFKNATEILKLCKNERIDYLALLLAKVGISWTWRFHEDEHDADLLEFNAVDQYKYPLKRLDLTDKISRQGVCILSSRDVAVLSHMVAQNCLTKAYVISDHTHALHKAANKIKHVSWDREVARAHESHDLFNDILLEQLNSFAYAEEVLGLDQGDLRILCSLYKKRNEAIRMTDIPDLTRAKGKKMYFRTNVIKLINQGLITSDTTVTTTTWAQTAFLVITTAGLVKIMEYRKFIHQNVFAGSASV